MGRGLLEQNHARILGPLAPNGRSEWQRIRDMTDEELQAEAIRLGSATVVGMGYITEEIQRRLTNASADRMESMTQTVVDLTKSIEGMTGTIKVLTLWAVGASIAAVIVAVIALVAS